MARTWLSVTVELLGGRGQDLWPYPGRIFAVGPSHTFLDLAEAINDAFARWDRSHLSVFTLADGRVITDPVSGDDMTSSVGGPLTIALDAAATKVLRTVRLGEEFQFTFDLGDDWTHRCTVGNTKIDPEAELGIRPAVPLSYWGWGSIPDQYGRRWSADDGESRVPPKPGRPHPMVMGQWPGRREMPIVDPIKVRRAIAAADADGFLAAVSGCEIDDALQQVGEGIPLLLGQQTDQAESMALSVINRLIWRSGPGDSVLSDDLLALLRGEPLPGRVLPVDLDMLSSQLEGDPELSSGGYLDRRTGEVYDESTADAAVVGEDAVIHFADDADRYLWFDSTGSRPGWQDMADFAERQRDSAIREKLENAIHGRGAFRAFRNMVAAEGLWGQWSTYADDRRLGRAREFLADSGIRVGGDAKKLRAL